jgi:hypothetical protein
VPGFLFATRFSGVGFTPVLRRQLAHTPGPGRLLARSQLTGYWFALSTLVALRDLNRLGEVIRLPRPSALVQHANRRLSRAGDGVLFAPTLAGVTVPNVVYVIGRGSGAKRLEFAVIGFDGKRYVLHGRLGNHGPPRFGAG